MGVNAGDSQIMSTPIAYATTKFVIRGYWFDGVCDLLCLGLSHPSSTIPPPSPS